MMIKGGYEMPDLEAGEKPAEAFQACASKKPYLDPKYTKEGNPKYAEQTLAWMACMNREGVEVSGNWDDDFFKFGKVRPGTDRQNVDRKCYIESYR
jgi:hypothetical protein